MSQRDSASPHPQGSPGMAKQEPVLLPGREKSPPQQLQFHQEFPNNNFKRTSTSAMTPPISKKPKMAPQTFNNYSASNYGQFQASPMNSGANTPIPQQQNMQQPQNQQQGGQGGGQGPGQPLDPDQLSDVISAVGLDLKQEEALLQQGVPQTGYGMQQQQYGYRQQGHALLDQKRVAYTVRQLSQEAGLRFNNDRAGETALLISHACEEWLNQILTQALVLSRHRRRSRNSVHSSLSRALKGIAVKDKEREDKRAERKNLLGLDHAEPESTANPEDQQHKAANMTAAMMSSGKKKYSWMAGGVGASAGGMGMGQTGGGRGDSSIKTREAKEEPGVALRDLLGALEKERAGVEKAIVKGYAKLRN
ncbi:Transcription initiation factor TFIID subunit 4 [Yarrowia sp. C11]|nr:Transcription initiation factor TFIID subunit 4 [Yarrowia sp. C11]